MMTVTLLKIPIPTPPPLICPHSSNQCEGIDKKDEGFTHQGKPLCPFWNYSTKQYHGINDEDDGNRGG